MEHTRRIPPRDERAITVVDKTGELLGQRKHSQPQFAATGGKAIHGGDESESFDEPAESDTAHMPEN